jgi:kynureninase
MNVPHLLEEARRLDAADPLAPFRSRFVHPDPALVYLDGNSLGRLAAASQQAATTLIEQQWGDRLIRSWNEGWFDAPERIGAKIARLIGAAPDEVIVADSTSVNLFKLVVAALRARPGRSGILTDDLNFPSDVYILQGVVDLLEHRHRLEIIASPDGIHGPVEALAAAADESTALVTLSHVVFKSGYRYDMAAINRMVHARGALVLWDLSHAAGSVPVDLAGSGADLAIGCTYKYLNGGPGAPAFLYVRRELQEQLINPIAGWMGQRNLFAFGLDYAPAAGMRRFLSGTPPVLSTALIEPGVDLLLEAGMPALHAKSMAQSDYLIGLWERYLKPLGYRLNTPVHAGERGSHVSLGHAEGWRIDQALIKKAGVLPDFRAPDNIRLGIAPLYNSFTDLCRAVIQMKRVVDERQYAEYPLLAPIVT